MTALVQLAGQRRMAGGPQAKAVPLTGRRQRYWWRALAKHAYASGRVSPLSNRDAPSRWSKQSIGPSLFQRKIGLAFLQDALRPMQRRRHDQRRSIRSTVQSRAEKQSPSTIAAGTPSCVRALKRGPTLSDDGGHGAVIPDLISSILSFYIGDTLTQSSMQTVARSRSECSGLEACSAPLGAMRASRFAMVRRGDAKEHERSSEGSQPCSDEGTFCLPPSPSVAAARPKGE